MEHIQPVKYRVWGWPAVANFVIGGMASGFYLLCFLHISLREGFYLSKPQSLPLLWVSPLLIIAALVLLIFEAGRPLRGIYLLGNLKSSWMSREVLSGTVFLASAIMNRLFPQNVFYLLSVVAALGYLISQGYMVHHARAVTAWNVALTPVLFLTSGIAGGVGLLLIVSGLIGLVFTAKMAVTGIVCLVVNLFVYGFYTLFPFRDRAFREAAAVLRNPMSLMSVAGIGHILPVIFLILLSSSGLNEMLDKHVLDILYISTGLAVVSASAFQKILLILWGNFLRRIVMNQPGSRSLC
jgi:DMSO reductase anchor subunit